MSKGKDNSIARIALIGGFIVLMILVWGTIWMGRSARRDTEAAVRTVSLLYLDELAGRREQVVENNLHEKVRELETAVSLMTQEDLSDKIHLEAYQKRMKQLYSLEMFAFVDKGGLIYTSTGMSDDVGRYAFDYRTLREPEISVVDLDKPDKRVVIAMPVDMVFRNRELSVCFVEIAMEEMLSGVSMTSNSRGATFCNIYTRDGIALSNTVLGGLAVEDNLLEAVKTAQFEEGYSYEKFLEEFQSGTRGEVSFAYDGIRETLSYVPVLGTDWLLTYLIRESVISDRIGGISAGIINRSMVQSVLTVLAMGLMFFFIIVQNRRNERFRIATETAEAENRVKQEEMEQRLILQERLLKEEKRRTLQDNMISALASDYLSVYYLEPEKNEGTCYQAHRDIEDGIGAGEHFPYRETMEAYADRYVKAPYRGEFLRFTSPEAVLEKLREEPVITYTYMVNRHGQDVYEGIRFASVKWDEREPGETLGVGACFVDVDSETRKSMAQNQALSDALAVAEQANRAKTAFLSNMSHEIRTPMNAIIGLDNIAMHDPETTPKIKGYLEKIGGAAEHLLGLINDILDMSRIESGRMVLKQEEFSFAKLLEAINTLFSGQCQEKGLDYQCHISGEVDDYYIGDGMKLRQVLINILGNAVKFTPAGGSVSLGVERKAQYDGKTAICFTIADTGIGMSPDFIPKIFETFTQEDSSTTSRFGSSGLGMAITKNIVEMMNGNIGVESEKGKGSTFTVTVTLQDSARKNVPGEVEKEIHPGDMTVLVVDDDPVACEHAKLVLEKAGIASETASSGARAIEMVRLRHARRTPYNLILVDWQMPEMDGVETTRQMRKIIGHESAIIILTAYRWDDVLEEAFEAGVDSFIPKPLFANQVLEEFRSSRQRKNIAAGSERKKAELTGRRILLAEDMQVNAEIIIMVLQMRGMETDHAENGRIALEKFADHPAGYYDAILMDMRMPEMDGLEATRRIRALPREDAKEIPIIALTANAFDEDVQRSLQAGLNAHLSKPVQPEALYETLEGLIPAES